jgi:hypothetical protein
MVSGWGALHPTSLIYGLKSLLMRLQSKSISNTIKNFAFYEILNYNIYKEEERKNFDL